MKLKTIFLTTILMSASTLASDDYVIEALVDDVRVNTSNWDITYTNKVGACSMKHNRTGVHLSTVEHPAIYWSTTDWQPLSDLSTQLVKQLCEDTKVT